VKVERGGRREIGGFGGGDELGNSGSAARAEASSTVLEGGAATRRDAAKARTARRSRRGMGKIRKAKKARSGCRKVCRKNPDRSRDSEQAEARRGSARSDPLFLGQRLVFGLGEEREDRDAEEQDEADPEAGGAEALEVAAEALGDLADGERRSGGDEAAEVVAEARAGGPEGWSGRARANRSRRRRTRRVGRSP